MRKFITWLWVCDPWCRGIRCKTANTSKEFCFVLALRAPEIQPPRIPKQSAHKGSKVIRPTHQPFLTQQKSLVLISATGNVYTRDTVRLEGLSQWKISMTSPGIEPATLRLVAQCHKGLRHRLPDSCTFIVKKKIKLLESASCAVTPKPSVQTTRCHSAEDSILIDTMGLIDVGNLNSWMRYEVYTVLYIYTVVLLVQVWHRVDG